jgi:tetrapyrrole methylase family protein / MazG family protein
MAIIILGLGPGDMKHLTQEAWQVLQDIGEIYVRTQRHPMLGQLPAHITVHSFDYVYEREVEFGAVYETIAREVLALGRRTVDVVYAVPGHPMVGESSVQHIRALAATDNVQIRIVDGLSFIEPTLTLLGLDALQGVQIADATELAALHHPPLDPDRPALVSQIYSRAVAADVKLTLMNQYPDEHPVTLVSAAGTAGAWQRSIPLHDLDLQGDIDHLTSLYVPPLAEVGAVESFQETVARLRAPDGCPWDREQTHLTLRASLLEETYEVLHALDTENVDELCEEMGDLLMQIVIHSQIATEESEFRFADVVSAIDRKIKRRHPHVFGNAVVDGSEEVLKNWEEIKRAERGQQDNENILANVPTALPALSVADSYQRRVVRVGFDWPNIQGVIDKIAEEAAEVRSAPNKEAQGREIGDLLFALVNYARWLEIDAESALRETNARFAHRFVAMERLARRRGTTLKDLPIDAQEALWQEVKKETDA